MVKKEDIIEVLKDVYDPEIPINIYDLGLIYDISISQDNNVKILMTLTSPTCPIADYIKDMVVDAISSIEGVSSVDVEVTFDPIWTPDKVSEEVREELGFESKETEMNNVDSLFSSEDNEKKIEDKEEKKENVFVCFNCGISDEKRPIVQCYYKGEKTYICSKCLGKFS